MQALAFEEISSRHVLAAPLAIMWKLDQLTDDDLEGLLGDALGG